MPKITKGGVSDRRIDPDYMAPSGTPVDVALDLGLPDAGKPEKAEIKPLAAVGETGPELTDVPKGSKVTRRKS